MARKHGPGQDLRRRACTTCWPERVCWARSTRRCSGRSSWLSAQPGAGKTTLIANYLQARDPDRRARTLWYQVDDGDADPASFIYHLRLAAEAATSPDAVAALPLLTPEYLADLRGFARRFFRELYAQLDADALLVFDNFQDVPDGAAFHRLMVEAIAQLPDGVHIVVISRTEPEGAYAPLLANDAIALVDGEALQLTLDETQAIARQRGVEGDGDARSLFERSHGWAAGLTLLLARTRASPDELADDTDSLQHVFGVFRAARVRRRGAGAPACADAARIPAADELDAGRAAHWPGRGTQAARPLLPAPSVHRSAARRRRRGVDALVFQFHALFRTFLRHQAAACWSPDEQRDVALRAGALLAEAGLTDPALGCFAEATDWAAYGRTVIAHAEALLEQGRRQTLVEWLARMPPGPTRCGAVARLLAGPRADPDRTRPCAARAAGGSPALRVEPRRRRPACLRRRHRANAVVRAARLVRDHAAGSTGSSRSCAATGRGRWRRACGFRRAGSSWSAWRRCMRRWRSAVWRIQLCTTWGARCWR